MESVKTIHNILELLITIYYIILSRITDNHLQLILLSGITDDHLQYPALWNQL